MIKSTKVKTSQKDKNVEDQKLKRFILFYFKKRNINGHLEFVRPRVIVLEL